MEKIIMIKKCSFYFFLFISVFGEWCFAIQNAGIFPFATFPGNKKRVVLLGKDHHRKGWMDFGGKLIEVKKLIKLLRENFMKKVLVISSAGLQRF